MSGVGHHIHYCVTLLVPFSRKSCTLFKSRVANKSRNKRKPPSPPIRTATTLAGERTNQVRVQIGTVLGYILKHRSYKMPHFVLRVIYHIHTYPLATYALQNGCYFEFDARTDRKLRPPFSSL